MEPNSSRLSSMGGRDTNSSNSSNFYTSRPEKSLSRKVVKTGGSLEIIEGSDSGMCIPSHDSPSNSRPPSNASSRPWSRSSVGSVPPRSDSSLSRRVNTPSKQVSLQAVRRKEESSEPFVDHVDWQSVSLDSGHRKTWERVEEGDADFATSSSFLEQFQHDLDIEKSQHATKLRLPTADQMTEEDVKDEKILIDDPNLMKKEAEMNREEKNKDKDGSGGKDDDDDEDDDDSDSSDEEEEERKAPNELLMEFVDCLMRKDFQNASKLCKMILLYEPENAEALKFQPLIEEKLALDAAAEKEAEEEGSGDEDDDDDDDSEDDSDDDDDDDDSDDDETSSDEDSSPDDDDDNAAGGSGLNAQNNGRNVEFGFRPPPQFHRTDSGIASDSET